MLNKAFHDWWTIHKKRLPIPKGCIIPILAAIQGHSEAPRLWAKYADNITKKLKLKPAGHEPCLYVGIYRGARVLLEQQVGDFELATA